MTPSDQITVLIPTSPIPSHPSTAIIEETIASVRSQLPTAEILVMIDGIRAEQADRKTAYDEYTAILIRLCRFHWSNVLPIVHSEHYHQAVMVRKVLPMVRTPLVLFVEHDTPLCGPDIEWEGCCEAVSSGAANVVRFSHEASILEPHRYLALSDEPMGVCGVPMIPTWQWSQRPHLTTARFYDWLLTEFFPPTARTMIEDRMHGIVDATRLAVGEPGWREYWRLFIYSPPGDIKRSTHLDGRGDDPMLSMDFGYGPGGEPVMFPTTKV